MTIDEQIAELQERILTLKLNEPWHPNIQGMILELEALINDKRQPTEQA